MARRREQIITDLKNARRALKNADDETALILSRREIDRLLDERLEERGVHPAECGCWECSAHIAAVLAARPLGELMDPRDLAGPEEWGQCGTI